MTFTETVEKLLSCEGDESCGFMYIVKFADLEVGMADLLDRSYSKPMKKRDDLIKCKNCDLDGYTLWTDFHVDETKRLGSR
ncbi:MAG: hypothetical protein R2883_06865 [Caldisericia bacterium]